MNLLTRSDFDGLVCGSLLKHLGIIDTWTFIHPKDMQDGKIAVTANDVLANVPYVPGCGMWFDHHSSEIERMGKNVYCPGECRLAPSCARIVYEYYDGKNTMPNFEGLVAACDKVDSGALVSKEIINPEGGVLLGFIMDPRTGLGRFRNFRKSNLDLMSDLLDACSVMSIEEILAMPDVVERVELYHKQTALFREMLLARSVTQGSVIVTDLRGVDVINAGNRFYIYSLFPECNVSCWIVDGYEKTNVSIAIGYSILNRTCRSNIGALCARYGGGGHFRVGTCQVPYNFANQAIEEIVTILRAENA